MEKNIRLHPPHRAEIRPTLLHSVATTPRSHKYYIQRELDIQYKYYIQGGIYSLVSQGCCRDNSYEKHPHHQYALPFSSWKGYDDPDA